MRGLQWLFSSEPWLFNSEAMEVVDAAVVMVLRILLLEDLMLEDDVVEPMSWWVGALAIVPLAAAACPLAEVPPVAEVSAIELAGSFGRRETFWLGQASVRHNLSYDRTFAWVAVQFGSIRGGALQAVGVDAHITMTYLKKSGTLEGAEVAAAMEACLQKIQKAQGGGEWFLKGAGAFNEEFAKEEQHVTGYP